MIESSNEFVNNLQDLEKPVEVFRMATITSIQDNKIYLTFYGEEIQREKDYKRLASYSPSVGDRVLVAKLNKSYTILGKVV